MKWLNSEGGWNHSWPQFLISTFLEVFPDCDPTASILSTTSIPSTTDPNTTCLPSNLEKWIFKLHKKPLTVKWKRSQPVSIDAKMAVFMSSKNVQMFVLAMTYDQNSRSGFRLDSNESLVPNRIFKGQTRTKSHFPETTIVILAYISWPC